MNDPLLLAPLLDPVPLGPVHTEATAEAHMTLRWQPSPGASRYRVQIAADRSFERPVFEHEVPGIADFLDIDYRGSTSPRLYYWRVLAGDGSAWSAGRQIEILTTGAAHEGGPLPDPEILRDFGVEPPFDPSVVPFRARTGSLSWEHGYAVEPGAHVSSGGTPRREFFGTRDGSQGLSLVMFVFAIAILLAVALYAATRLAG